MYLLAACLSGLLAVGNLAGPMHPFKAADPSQRLLEPRWSPLPLPVHLGPRQAMTDPGRWWRVISAPGLDGALDVIGRRYRLSLGGDDGRLLLHLDWKSGLDSNSIRIRSRINFALFGRAIALTPPDLRIGPRFGGGGTDVVLQMPIFERRF